MEKMFNQLLQQMKELTEQGIVIGQVWLAVGSSYSKSSNN